MENLQPIIKHRFWVCLGLSFVFIILGWWLGTSSLATEAEANLKKIEGSETALPKGDQHANDDWIAKIKNVNGQQVRYYQNHAHDLWNEQKIKRIWPTDVAPLMANAEHFGKGSNQSALDLFRVSYHPDTIRRLHNIVDPIVERTNVDLSVSFPGKVLFNEDQIPKVPKDRWALLPPSWEEMWLAEQDAWLVRALLKSVARVNELKGATSIHDASIRQIVSLILRGGSKVDPAAAATGTEGSAGGPEGPGMAPKGMMLQSGGGQAGGADPFGLGGGAGGAAGTGRTAGMNVSGMGAGGGGNDTGVLPVDLDLVFGPQIPKKSVGTAGAEGEPSTGETGSTPDYSGSGGSGSAGMMAGGGGTGQQSDMSPYVDNDPDMPFKTRGFVIKVLMKRKDVPLFIQELTDARKTGFPIEIRLIHQLDKNHSDFTGEAVRQQYGAGTGAQTTAGTGITPGLPGQFPMGSGLGGYGPMSSSSPMGSGRGPGAIPGRNGGFPGTEGPATGPGGATGILNRAPYLAALDDDGLGYVVIAGLMTIYQPPKKTTAETGSGNTETKPPESTNPVTPMKPAIPANNTQKTSGTNTPAATGKSTKTDAQSGSNAEKTAPKPRPMPTIPAIRADR